MRPPWNFVFVVFPVLAYVLLLKVDVYFFIPIAIANWFIYRFFVSERKKIGFRKALLLPLVMLAFGIFISTASPDDPYVGALPASVLLLAIGLVLLAWELTRLKLPKFIAALDIILDLLFVPIDLTLFGKEEENEKSKTS